MLRKPSPWLSRRVPGWLRTARRARSNAASAVARLQLGQLAFDVGELSAGLERVALSRWLGAAPLEEVVRENIAVHGSGAVTEATVEAVSRLGGQAKAVARLSIAVARCQDALGEIVAPLDRLRPLGAMARPARLHSRLSQHARLLEHGIAMPDPAQPAADRVPNRVIYYAAQSLPHHSSGYAIRTHWLVRSLHRRNWDVLVHTRFGYPNDRYDFLGVNLVDGARDVDGVSYRFDPAKRGYLRLDIESYQEAAVDRLVRRAKPLLPALVHCASNYSVGLAGVEAARRLGVPCVYEVRGLWHLTRAARQPEYADSDHYRLIESLEVAAASAADRVVVITDAVGEVLRDRGVAADKITVVPNAVDVDEFGIAERDDTLARSWGIGSETVIGYIGTFKDYEGLDDLLRAAARLRDNGAEPFRLLLVGDGDVFQDLIDLSRSLGLADIAVFTGRQPHERIARFYSLVDIMAFPRRGLPLCEVVSPLKPFEAMATGTAVVASSVRALTEIVDHENTGLIHEKDDVDSLGDQLGRLLVDRQLRARLAAAARQWVSRERSWAAVGGGVDAIYRQLGLSSDSR